MFVYISMKKILLKIVIDATGMNGEILVKLAKRNLELPLTVICP